MTVVAISPRIHPVSDRAGLPDSPYFRLVGLDELSQAIDEETSRALNFSRQELKILVEKVLN